MVPNLERLSLCRNNLKTLPADIGRLHKLRCLKLSNNRLKNDSIPYTLSFCTQLITLLVDGNALGESLTQSYSWSTPVWCRYLLCWEIPTVNCMRVKLTMIMVLS